MALINEIKIVERELKMWIDRNAVVYSDTGIWMYTLEHHNGVRGDSWEDDEDYLDNVRSDFLGEAGENGKDIENTELFEKVAEVLFIKDYDRYGYFKDEKALVDYKETLPELLENGAVEVLAS